MFGQSGVSSYFVRGVFLVAGLLTRANAQVSPPAALSYQGTIQPIIFKNCNGCHTFGGHAGGLRMDSFDSLLEGGDRGPAIIQGDPSKSLLIKAIHYDDPAIKMPPKGKLAESDIAAIEQWIAQGAAPGAPAAPTAIEPATTPATSPAPTYVPAAHKSEPEPAAASDPAPKPTPEQEQFFESKIRPVLAKNCYGCHTSSANGGLRLDSRQAMLKGGKDGVVVVAGHPESSLLVSAIHYSGKIQMPPVGRLKSDDIASLEDWIRDGAPWPEGVAISPSRVTDAQRNFWAFRAPARPAAPAFKSAWTNNDIDKFILAKLQEKHLKPVADADKRTLIRRVTYDLTGLPPTPVEIQAFLDDNSPGAYEKVVERLLASKAYGERWGRMWLDVVRYADTTGGGGDYPIPQAYKYRDYVIQSFIDDKPYDRFIREQIAGDLLPYKSEPEHWQNLVATGYLAGTVRGDGKSSALSDAVDNLGSAFLGLTVGCARCHDHKFDPIPTSDYYALYGILASTQFPHPGDDEARFQHDFVYRDPQVKNREDYKIFQAQLKPIQDAIEAVLKLPGTYDDLIPQLEARRMHLYAHMPDFGESAYAVTEGDPEDVRIQHYGDDKDLGDLARRGFPQVLGGSALPTDAKGSGRLELANWIASNDNPLTARTIVNRIWQGHFGRGIVATANDFGTRGLPPSNRDLLDYLAGKLVDSGWSLKAIHREILLSHAYRLSSAGSPANEEIDPDNEYVWRHSRVRLDAEEIRDSLLADSKLLDNTPPGPHPFPPQSEWNWEDQNHFSPVMARYETNRRTVYTMVQRTVRQTYFTLFDGPNTNVSTEQRSASLTPLQSLYFLNAEFPEKCAQHLASQLVTLSSPTKGDVEQAFLLIYGRPPGQAELDRILTFLPAAAAKFSNQGVSVADAQQRAFTEFLKAMFASNEFMFVE
jgi:mono/diheme cytochrome c family protein